MPFPMPRTAGEADNSVLVALDQDRIIAVGAVRDSGEITLNYVSPAHRFRGGEPTVEHGDRAPLLPRPGLRRDGSAAAAVRNGDRFPDGQASRLRFDRGYAGVPTDHGAAPRG